MTSSDNRFHSDPSLASPFPQRMTDTETSDFSPLSDSTLVADGDSFRDDDAKHVPTDKEALEGSEPQGDVYKKAYNLHIPATSLLSKSGELEYQGATKHGILLFSKPVSQFQFVTQTPIVPAGEYVSYFCIKIRSGHFNLEGTRLRVSRIPSSMDLLVWASEEPRSDPVFPVLSEGMLDQDWLVHCATDAWIILKLQSFQLQHPSQLMIEMGSCSSHQNFKYGMEIAYTSIQSQELTSPIDISPKVSPSKVYSCGHDGCTKKFSRLFNLQTHERIHDPSRKKESICKLCGQQFARVQDLSRHAVVHTGSKDFSCPGCDKMFSRKDALRRHVKSLDLIMPFFLIHFAQYHGPFRIPELDSLAILENVQISYDLDTYSDDNPFLIVELASIEDASRLVTRAILIKEIIHLYAWDTHWDSLVAKVQSMPKEIFEKFNGHSFKFKVDYFGCSISMEHQLEIINRFAFLNFDGDIKLKNPDNIFSVIEDYGTAITTPVSALPKRVFFGHMIARGNRHIVNKYDLKKRKYLGTTSMDAELSLVMANQALVTPHSFVFDPFVGTGSFLVTCSHFGGFTQGSDIDGRQIRGKDNTGVESNLEQYNLAKRVLGTVVCDFAHHPWRQGEFWDAIVCDPPYGVRAGAKKIDSNDSPQYRKDGKVRYPDLTPYEMESILHDLVQFSAAYLAVGGRLVYWLPTVAEEYKPEDVPQHPSLRLVSNSEQAFGQWSRRLITMEKIRPALQVELDPVDAITGALGHSHFRDRYFRGFKNE